MNQLAIDCPGASSQTFGCTEKQTAKKAKVLHISATISMGGLEHHLLALCSDLVEKSFDVVLAYWRGGGELKSSFEARGIKVKRLNIKKSYSPLNFLEFSKLIKAEKPDIVHTHGPLAEIYGNWAARWHGIRSIVSTKHADEVRWKIPWVRPFHYLASIPNSAIIAISNHVASYTKKMWVANKGKVATFHYGLDLKVFDALLDRVDSKKIRAEIGAGDSLLVGTVARLEPQKGIEYLIQAIPTIREQVPGVKFVIVGRGSKEAFLKTVAEKIGASDDIIWLKNRKDVPHLMSVFDLFVLPSTWEGFGLVLLEAMACSKAIVASRVSAIPEIVVDKETGVLVEPRDSKALADSVTLLLKDKPMAYEMGVRGRARVEEEFRAEKMCEQTQLLYEKLLNRMGRSEKQNTL
jgi:glycosyltransferase involved in cell wall biosynthesis